MLLCTTLFQAASSCLHTWLLYKGSHTLNLYYMPYASMCNQTRREGYSCMWAVPEEGAHGTPKLIVWRGWGRLQHQRWWRAARWWTGSLTLQQVTECLINTLKRFPFLSLLSQLIRTNLQHTNYMAHTVLIQFHAFHLYHEIISWHK